MLVSVGLRQRVVRSVQARRRRQCIMSGVCARGIGRISVLVRVSVWTGMMNR